MMVRCPECGAKLDGEPGVEKVCPACLTPFLVPAAARAVRAFDVQPAGDAVIHGMSRHAIREAIYTGRLDAATKVRHDGGPWALIGGYPEFAAVFRVLGGDLGPMAGTRKLAGWGRGGRRDDDPPTVPPRTPLPKREAAGGGAPAGAAPASPAPAAPAPRAPAAPAPPAPAATPVAATPVRDLRHGRISVKTLPADERVQAKDRSRVIGAVVLGVVLIVVVIAAVV